MPSSKMFSSRELYDAAQSDEIVPVYQCIVDIGTGEVTGVEVLCRWIRKDGIEFSPDYFIPAFTDVGLINQLTQSILRNVASEINSLGGKLIPLELHINFSTLHIQSDEFVHDCFCFMSKIRRHDITLVVEITELNKIFDMTSFKRNMNRLRAAGVRFFIDDFGTGYANMDLLLYLDVDGIKIDKIFTREVTAEPRAKFLIQVIINLAMHWDLDIIAEGIEKYEQMDSLRNLKVYKQQGFLFSKPLKINDMETILLERFNIKHQLIF